MNNIISWTVEDEAIIATNTDATECKRCAVELGYWKDEYISYFAKHVDRKAPEINRGYYARVKAMEMFIHQFLERCGTKCQIINLGCGYDTLYWRLKDTTQAVSNFIELDFPSVISKKCHIIKRNKQLLEKICNEVYLRPDAADRLLAHLAAAFPRCVLLVYEQCNLGDKFGEVMVRNLSARGCLLAGERHCRQPAAQEQRLRAAGFERARCWDMQTVWRALPDDDRARVEALEMLDECELLLQLNSHYALTVASRGDLFADLDLSG
ncbi:leucine carboxyl methyltransferase 1 [Zerene cesonia]|uniref:leucine carboxyl methyltransferase 1 n=1 Tax=Zerene cesonia TaxID=33412 RepID=UPI0018E57E1A|nr:leucine carboxyl methyltransferase 1 [Zerene cesonia]